MRSLRLPDAYRAGDEGDPPEALDHVHATRLANEDRIPPGMSTAFGQAAKQPPRAPRLCTGRRPGVSRCGRITPAFAERPAARACAQEGASAIAYECVTAWRDAPEVRRLHTTGSGREAAIDRIPGYRPAKQSFDSHLRIEDAHRAPSHRQRLDERPLNNTVSEALRTGQRIGTLPARPARRARSPTHSLGIRVPTLYPTLHSLSKSRRSGAPGLMVRSSVSPPPSVRAAWRLRSYTSTSKNPTIRSSARQLRVRLCFRVDASA